MQGSSSGYPDVPCLQSSQSPPAIMNMASQSEYRVYVGTKHIVIQPHSHSIM